MSRTSHISSLTLGSKFGEKYMRDFSALTSCLDSLQNWLNTFLMDSAPALLALVKSVKSSAKNKWEIPKFCLDTFNRVHSFFQQLSLMRKPRYSIQSINRYRDNGEVLDLELDLNYFLILCHVYYLKNFQFLY